ncbi:MAG TPA: uroporphyrinogen decarboxylase [Fimbriimonas sp.]
MNDRFLRACRGEQTDCPPIWLMRQAGRYLPEYREARKGLTMLQAVNTPEVAIEVTLQPIRRFGFDAAILFSDLTVPFTPMGAPFEIKEGVGPVVEHPVRTASDMDRIHRFEVEEGLPFVLETIRGLKRELDVPLIGFTGAPFTLASYLIEGGPSRDLKRTKAMMLGEPALWHRLMELLSSVVADYLCAQLDAGADAVQLFDSWIGSLDERRYREYLLPHMQRIFEQVARKGKPTIHFGTGNPTLLPIQKEAGGGVFGVDFRMSLTDAAKLIPGTPLQGNLDPTTLQTNPEVVAREAKRIVEEGRRLPGHIFNLGHGILPETPLENVEALVHAVRS